MTSAPTHVGCQEKDGVMNKTSSLELPSELKERIERVAANSSGRGQRGIVGIFLMERTTDHKEALKKLLARRSVSRQGKFTLSSGRESEYYIDCKLTTLDPEGAVLTGYTVFEFLRANQIRAEAIGGMSIGADPIVTAVAVVSGLEGNPLPAFIVRKEAKAHGLRKQVEGIELTPGKRVVIVDDVCTVGDATREAIAAVERAGLKVVAVVSLVDREEGGSELLRQKYDYYSIFTAKELLEEYERAPRESGNPPGSGRSRAPGDPRPA